MDANSFCYWLQGFAELANTPTLSDAQWQAIKDHLALVFKKVTPAMPSHTSHTQIATPIYHPVKMPDAVPLPHRPFAPTITCKTSELMRAAVC